MKKERQIISQEKQGKWYKSPMIQFKKQLCAILMVLVYFIESLNIFTDSQHAENVVLHIENCELIVDNSELATLLIPLKQIIRN